MEPLWQYRIVTELWYRPELGTYRTYGIQSRVRRHLRWRTVRLIHDVTADYQLIRQMTTLFNRYQLCPIHLTDVIYDMLP